MSRYDTKEFGEAAQFLRKSDLELMATHTVAFDGRPNKESSKKRSLIGQIKFKKIFISEVNSVFDSMLNSYLFLNKAEIQPMVLDSLCYYSCVCCSV